MFSKKKQVTYQRLLNLNEEELNEFAKRLSGYYKQQEAISKLVVINSFFILDLMIKEKIKREKENMRWKTKNIILLKYAKEVKHLYEVKHLGSSKILLHLKVNHAIKKGISKSTIDRFIKNHNLKRDTRNG